jgi:hypothetical protein
MVCKCCIGHRLHDYVLPCQNLIPDFLNPDSTAGIGILLSMNGDGFRETGEFHADTAFPSSDEENG